MGSTMFTPFQINCYALICKYSQSTQWKAQLCLMEKHLLHCGQFQISNSMNLIHMQSGFKIVEGFGMCHVCENKHVSVMSPYKEILISPSALAWGSTLSDSSVFGKHCMLSGRTQFMSMVCRTSRLCTRSYIVSFKTLDILCNNKPFVLDPIQNIWKNEQIRVWNLFGAKSFRKRLNSLSQLHLKDLANGKNK